MIDRVGRIVRCTGTDSLVAVELLTGMTAAAIRVVLTSIVLELMTIGAACAVCGDQGRQMTEGGGAGGLRKEIIK
jgi:hypothetical protein